MEKKFTATFTYSHHVFYHRALVSGPDHVKAAKNSFFADLQLTDYLMSALAFGVYFLIMTSVDLPNRLFQSCLALILFVSVMRSLNRMRKSTKEPARSETALNRVAKADLNASGQDGEECTVVFGEDSFLVMSPGMETEYGYEGVTRIKETADFFMIFKGKLTIIPVEKAGIEEEKTDELREFLEERCELAVERIGEAASMVG